MGDKQEDSSSPDDNLFVIFPSPRLRRKNSPDKSPLLQKLLIVNWGPDKEELWWKRNITGFDWSLIKRSETQTVQQQHVQRIHTKLNCKQCSYHGRSLPFGNQKYYEIMA